MFVDLHIHTTATAHHSSWAPRTLAATARREGLAVIACADHNTTASVLPLLAAGFEVGVQVVSGVEIDSGFNGKLWHTLVYGANPRDAELIALCEAVYSRNVANARTLRDELAARGYLLTGLDTIGRAPNVAEVATALAHAYRLPGRQPEDDDEAAGMRFVLTQLRGVYQPVGVDEVIRVAHRLDGVAILAHPGRQKGIYAIPADAADLAALVEAGLDGVEVYYPSHSAEQQAFYLELARRHALLVSAGSDSHHPHQPLARWEATLIRPLLERLGCTLTI